jgi:hypothetical protein
LDLRDAKGNWRVGTTLKALRDLELQGLWRFPRTTRRYSGKWEPIRLQQPVAAAVDVPARAEEVSGLELIEVTDREHRRIWNELMLREHPLQECRLVGRQLRYLVGSKHGWLGGLVLAVPHCIWRGVMSGSGGRQNNGWSTCRGCCR